MRSLVLGERLPPFVECELTLESLELLTVLTLDPVFDLALGDLLEPEGEGSSLCLALHLFPNLQVPLAQYQHCIRRPRGVLGVAGPPLLPFPFPFPLRGERPGSDLSYSCLYLHALPF